MSTTSPIRFNGVSANSPARYSGSSKRCAFMRVRTLPGAMALTRTPLGASSTAGERTSASIAPFDAP